MNLISYFANVIIAAITALIGGTIVGDGFTGTGFACALLGAFFVNYFRNKG